MQSKVIAVASGKGGIGKTISALNLGIALNELGKNTVIVDANLTMPNIALHLGAPTPPLTLSHVLQGKAQIAEALYAHHSGTEIVPGSISLKLLPTLAAKTSTARFARAISYLKKRADFVIVDSAPGLGPEALLALRMCDEVLILTSPELPSVTDALKTARMAQKLKKKVLGAVITRITKDRAELGLRSVKQMLELPILAKIPEDNSVRQALKQRNAVVLETPKSQASQAYRKLASKIARADYSEERSLLERLFGWLRR